VHVKIKLLALCRAVGLLVGLYRPRLPIHPRTGLMAVGLVAGRPVWPVLGAAPPQTRADEIRTRQSTIRDDLTKLEEEATDDLEEDKAAEIALRTQVLTEEWDTLDKELAPLASEEAKAMAVREAKLAEIRTRMAADARNIEHGFGAPGGGDMRVRTDPFRNLPDRISMLGSTEMRVRAEGALKVYAPEIPKEGTELIGRMLEWDPTNSTAEFVLATSTPAYRSAFLKWLRDPATGPNTWTADEAAAYQRTYQARAALSLTPANGGYLVPFTLDPTIILPNAGSANPSRGMATIKTTSTNDWNGVTSSGVNAEWTAEGTEAADATPTVGPLKVTPQKADAYVFGSYEVLGDSDFSSQFPDLLADAKDRLEEAAFAVGTGTGQPKGITVAGTTVAAASGLVIHIGDVYALQNSLPARFRGPRSRQAWVAALATINALRQLAKFTGSTDSLVDDSGDTPRMLGKPINESSSIPTALTNGTKVLSYLDLAQYYIVDRIGVSMVYDPLVLGTNRRPTGQGAYYAFWRTGADAAVATAIRNLSITT
jgi:HK97 family phage major capsid protein